MNSQQQLRHLCNRAGFGPSLALWQKGSGPEDYLSGLIRSYAPQPLEIITEEEWLADNPKALKAAGITGEALKMKRKSFREKTGELNLLWLQQMVTADNPLQEKTALFWHGHFATRGDNPYFAQQLLQEIRKNALGNFGDLLSAVSKSPAMLQFLNNQQNKKQHPNENFAREVMELFTLGRGHYTETDIKKAARAFTGWAYDENGEFILRERQHDDGVKTFLGQKGAFTGDDILRILLEQKQTALFITQKLYRFFVNEEKRDPARIQSLAGDFYTNKYDIGKLLQAMLDGPAFYKDANSGARIKSPVELLVGMMRTVPVSFKNERTFINLQRVLGQQLFYPPNVAGWPGGRAWIDTSSLAIRMRLPETFYADKELDLHAKEQDAEMIEVSKKPIAPQDAQPDSRFKVGKGEADWSAYLDYWKAIDDATLPRRLADYLIAVPVSDAQLQTLKPFADSGSKEKRIKSWTILLMSLPEYQLC